METATDDFELLRAYANDRVEPAFTALVERYVPLVYSAASRQVPMPDQAEEIVQAVFLILARKAGSIRRAVILPGWLLRTTRYVVANARRREQRRQHAERAAMNQYDPPEIEAAWERIAPILDQALIRLSDRDRNAIALRFFQQKSFKEVGTALGLSENSARMCVARAVDRLRAFFGDHGLRVPAATLGAVLSAEAVQAAPPGLAASVSAVTISQGAGATAAVASLVKVTLRLLVWSKLKSMATLGLPLLLVLGGGTYVATALWEKHSAPNLLRNGGFDHGLEDWAGHVDPTSGAQASFSEEVVPERRGRVAKISVSRASLNFYDCVELSQGPFPVQTGHRYAVTFRARSSVQQPLRVKLIGFREPWPFYGFRVITELTPQWRKYRLTSYATVTGPEAKFVFQCGALAGDIWLDDVKFEDCGKTF